MFWFCKPKVLNIHFFTAREEVFNYAKPKKASAFIPEWFKNLPKSTFSENLNDPLVLSRSIKTCPGFVSLYSSGFMFPLWSDLNIEICENSWRYQFIDKKSSIEKHDPKQLGGCGFVNTHEHMKIINPWLIKTEEKIDVLLTAPTWNEVKNSDVIIAPGVIPMHKNVVVEPNINIFVKRQKDRVVHVFFLGQPLVHVIPLAERPIKLHYHLISETEFEKMRMSPAFNLMTLNRYKRGLKICPHE